jgi:hypothetical protein
VTRGPLPVVAFALAAAIIASLLAYPLRHATPWLDDFTFLALGTHLEEPLVLLTRDSLGAYFFRPVGMGLWWLSVQVLGVDGGAHAALNVALHGANGVLLFALMRRLGIAPGAGAVAAMAFVVHPTAFSAAAWLADRFDLLAMFFGLFALLHAQGLRQRPDISRLAALGVTLAMALACKEVAFAFAVTAGLVLLLPSRESAAPSTRWHAAGLVIIAIAACGALVARTRVLGEAGGFLLRDGLPTVLAQGFAGWIEALPAFLAVQHGSFAAFAVVIASLAGLAALSIMPGARAAWRGSTLPQVVALGVALAVLAALAQAPVIRIASLHPYGMDAFSAEALTASRFFYVPLAGIALVLGALCAAAASALPGAARAISAAIALAALVALLAASRTIGREWQAFSQAGLATARAATQAVGALEGLKPGCKVYLLGIAPEEDFLRAYIDTRIKGALPRNHPAMGCFLLTEHTPWMNLLDARAASAGDEAPLRLHVFDGRPLAPLRVGNLTLWFVNLKEDSGAAQDPRATFLAREGARFVDVTEAVRSGSRPVRFHDNRNGF